MEKVEAPFDKEKEQRKNFVFVEFDTEDAVEKVLNHTTENPDYKHMLGGEEVSWFEVPKILHVLIKINCL